MSSSYIVLDYSFILLKENSALLLEPLLDKKGTPYHVWRQWNLNKPFFIEVKDNIDIATGKPLDTSLLLSFNCQEDNGNTQIKIYELKKIKSEMLERIRNDNEILIIFNENGTLQGSVLVSIKN